MAVNGMERVEASQPVAETTIRPLLEADLDTADHVMRMAFGTYLKAPDPLQVFGDSDYVHTRYRAAPDCGFAAELNGEVVGSNFATRWGSFGFFGPLTVRTDLWDRGIATMLMAPVMELFGAWGVDVAGLFTFPESPKHISLYQKFGFWPQRLSPLLAKTVEATPGELEYGLFSSLPEAGRTAALDGCRRVCETVMDGLDLEREIIAAEDHDLGETILLAEGNGIEGFAVCHCGPRTEAGSGACFVKFGAVLPGPGAGERFERLLDACEALAADRGLSRLVGGANTARQDAYRAMLSRGYRAFLNGVEMLRPDVPGFSRADAYVINDLR